MVRVILMTAFEIKEVVVAALIFIGKFAADRRAGLVDGTAARGGVEEPADAAEVLVLLSAHDPFVAMTRLGKLGFGFVVG